MHILWPDPGLPAIRQTDTRHPQGALTVSYTHLDVYKRQGQRLAQGRRGLRRSHGDDGHASAMLVLETQGFFEREQVVGVDDRRYAPVSYTHLDVYKRQQQAAAESWPRRKQAAVFRVNGQFGTVGGETSSQRGRHRTGEIAAECRGAEQQDFRLVRIDEIGQRLGEGDITVVGQDRAGDAVATVSAEEMCIRDSYRVKCFFKAVVK